MNNITLYGFFPYDRGAKARWLMTELKVPFENRFLDNEKKEHEQDDYLKVNPLGRVPALVIDGKPIIESGAICAYLTDRFIEGGMAPAFAASERLDYQQWMYYATSTIDPLMTRMMIIEDILPGEVFNQKMEVLMSDMREVVDYLDRELSKKEYLVANKFSSADISVSYHMYFLNLWPEFKAMIDSAPNLLAYMKRLQNRPSALDAKVFSYDA